MAPEPVFFTPPPAPRHLAELRIDPAHYAVAFSAPCAADARRKRRCLLPASSVRKRMLLELPPFHAAPNTPSTPPAPPPTPTSPMAPRAAFSFEPGLRPRQPTSAGGSEAGCAGNMFAFLAAPERPNTPTGPTSRGGFVFAASPEGPLTPTSRGGFVFAASPEGPLTPTSRGSNTRSLTFLASPKQPLTPICSTASGCEASLTPTGSGAAASLHSAKTARTGATGGVGFECFPSKGTACAKLGSPSSTAAKKTTLPPVGLGTPSFVFSASRTLPPRRGGSRKRPRPNLRIETTARSMSPRLWEEDTTPPQQQQQQLTPSPQKLAKTNSTVNPAASRSSIMSEPCCAFFASPGKAAKQEARKVPSEASRSPAGSRCTSSKARTSSPEKPRKPEQEVEVSSAVCSGTELLLRVTCKCGIHKEFSFDHRV